MGLGTCCCDGGPPDPPPPSCEHPCGDIVGNPWQIRIVISGIPDTYTHTWFDCSWTDDLGRVNRIYRTVTYTGMASANGEYVAASSSGCTTGAYPLCQGICDTEDPGDGIITWDIPTFTITDTRVYTIDGEEVSSTTDESIAGFMLTLRSRTNEDCPDQTVIWPNNYFIQFSGGAAAANASTLCAVPATEAGPGSNGTYSKCDGTADGTWSIFPDLQNQAWPDVWFADLIGTVDTTDDPTGCESPTCAALPPYIRGQFDTDWIYEDCEFFRATMEVFVEAV